MQIFKRLLGLIFFLLFSFSLFSCSNQTISQNSWFSDFFDSKEVNFNFSTKDYIHLGQYKGLFVTEKNAKVSEKDYQNELSYRLSLHSNLVNVMDRGIQNGDIVLIDYYCDIIDDKSLNHLEENYEIDIGFENNLSEINNALLGATIGQTLTIELTFPLDYSIGEFAGKRAIFTVTIKK